MLLERLYKVATSPLTKSLNIILIKSAKVNAMSYVL